ncbi:MAG TPA: FAD-dependent monooxygenase [Conexibacter sp.]|nr:FAD-dependent monooxygenase [Conexibacter sp.]
MRSLNVTIVGAGIGGLSCAIALRAAGCDVRVFERAPELRPIGAGICMWPNGARALRALQVTDEFDGLSPLLRTLSYRDREGRELRAMSLADLAEHAGQRAYPLARADLHVALLTRMEDGDVTLGAECVGVEQDGDGVEAAFADGTRVRSDLLIGADGLRSVVRAQALPEPCELRHYYRSWVGLVPSSLELTPADTFTFFVGEHQRVGLLDVGAGRTYFFCDAPLVPGEEPPGADAREQLRGLFAGWPGTVQRLIDHVDPADTPGLPICDFDPLSTFVNGRVALLGDAAHATTPTLGQGGALAMEDSLILAGHVARHDDLAAALAAYDAERRPRVERVVLAARARTEAMLGVITEAEQAWYRTLGDDATRDFIDQLAEIAATAPQLALAG